MNKIMYKTNLAFDWMTKLHRRFKSEQFVKLQNTNLVAIGSSEERSSGKHGHVEGKFRRSSERVVQERNKKYSRTLNKIVQIALPNTKH